MAIQYVRMTLNGATVDLTYNSTSGYYEKTITAPNKSSYNINSDHYYPITVQAADTAGNTTSVNDTDSKFGAALKLDANEHVLPVSTIKTPTEGQYLIDAKPTVTWTVTDNDSGVNPNTIGVTIDAGSKITSGITKTAITGGYSCSYAIGTALSDGSHTIKVDAQDYDGNNAVQRTVTITVDTVPPQLSITAPVNNLVTNQVSLTVAGATNDATSSPCTVTVKLNSAAAITVPVGSNGAFSTTLTLSNGVNTIVVTTTDKAGRSTSVTRTVTLDTEAPEIIEIIVTPNPVSTGEPITIKVKVTD